MAINFPSTPSSGDLHTDGDLVWKYNGSAWDSFYGPSTAAQFGLGNVDNTSDADKPVSTAQQAAISAISKSSLGLGNVDNTSDLDKPVSTLQQAAIDTAANITPQSLTDAATISYDLDSGHNAKVTLTASRTLALPSNLVEGASGVLTVTQGGLGSYSLTFGSGWFVSAGAASDIAALSVGQKAQVTWYAYTSSNVNATILPLQ